MGTPKLRYNRTTNRYRVTINGRDHWLGRDQDEAERAYHRLILEWKSGTFIDAPLDDIRICELIDLYTTAMTTYYQSTPGSWHRGKAAMGFLNKACGTMRPAQFDMKTLRLLREAMGEPREEGRPALCRTGINRCMREVARFWKWCASMEYAPIDIYAKCSTLDPLQRGRCNARETEPIDPADSEHVKATKPFVNASVRAMIELQELCGMRPGEVCGLKAEMIDRKGPVWRCELKEHKNAHRGKRRVLFFGPKAQKVLVPFLLKRAPGEYLFQPKDHWEERTANKTGDGRRKDQLPTKRISERTVTDHYTKDTYHRAVKRACVKANVPHWHPNQLRHGVATEVREKFGIEAAGAVLGHAHLNTTEIYAQTSLALAERIAAEIG